MTLNEYQKATNDTAKYPGNGQVEGLFYCGLALAGEAGEIANAIKKITRDDGVFMDEKISCTVRDKKRADIINELGDVLWYAAQIAESLGVGLDQVAKENLSKLEDRVKSGILKNTREKRKGLVECHCTNGRGLNSPI